MKMKKSTYNALSVGFIFIIFLGLILFVLFMNNLSQDDVSDTSSNQEISQNIKRINVSEFTNELESENAIILDIRTPGEFAQGRIEGAENIDFYASDFESQLDKLDKDAEYKIYCNSGNRSATALEMMREKGFTNVVELSGGIQAWVTAGNNICTNC